MRFRIRSKLAAALVVPLVALVAGSGLLAMDARAEADEVDTEIELSLVALGPGSLTGALQDERNSVARDVLGLGDTRTGSVGSLADAVAATDAAVAQLESQLQRFDPAVRAAFGPALDGLDEVGDIRARSRDLSGGRGVANLELTEELLDAYRSLIDRFLAASAVLAADLDHSTLRNGVEISDAVQRRGEALSVAITHLAVDTLRGERSPEAGVAISASAARARLLQERVDQLAVGPYATVVADDPTQGAFAEASAAIDAYLKGEALDPGALLETAGLGSSTQADAVTDVLRREAGSIHADARAQMRLYVIAAAVVVSLAILVSYFASTSITRPLRALRREADELARTRLPAAVRSILEAPPGEDVAVPQMDPIGIQTRDEVGDVAGALTEVQSSTLTLAADQAVLRRNFVDSFVNLGRRNQLLLDRQLDFITQLEQNETDPEQLDALFRLDHLATRMRRNAESLLVLAGAESPRQWGTPVSMTDLVRSGLAEVEDYQRVNIRHLDEAEVAGQAVAGLAHVLAELAENALAYSPPGEQVEVKGRWSANGDYVIAIADNGIGMTDDELEAANRRLSGQESYTVAPSRYLGHYVAGNLARQLGVTVRLQDDPAGGLVATVTLPPTLLGPSDATGDALEPSVVSTDGAGAGWVEGDWTEEDWPTDVGTDPEPAPETSEHVPGRAVTAPDATPEPAEPDLEHILYGRLYGGDERVPEPPLDEHPPAPVAPAPVAPEHAGTAPEAPAPPVAAPREPEADGLPRRVPGAQRPDLTTLSARRNAPDADVPTTATSEHEAPTADRVNGRAGGALGFLQAFQSGAGAGPSPERTPTSPDGVGADVGSHEEPR